MATAKNVHAVIAYMLSASFLLSGYVQDLGNGTTHNGLVCLHPSTIETMLTGRPDLGGTSLILCYLEILCHAKLNS